MSQNDAENDTTNHKGSTDDIFNISRYDGDTTSRGSTNDTTTSGLANLKNNIRGKNFAKRQNLMPDFKMFRYDGEIVKNSKPSYADKNVNYYYKNNDLKRNSKCQKNIDKDDKTTDSTNQPFSSQRHRTSQNGDRKQDRNSDEPLKEKNAKKSHKKLNQVCNNDPRKSRSCLKVPMKTTISC